MMQKKVQIISDGSLDLSQELTKEKDIEVVPFYVSFDSETYQKEMVEVGVREFYQEWWITRLFSQRHPCHPCMIIMRCLKTCEGAAAGHLYLYHQKIQWFPAVCDNSKRYDIRGIPGCTDHGH